MKMRLDQLLLHRQLVESRERGKSLIMEGQVYVDGQKADKPGSQVEETAEIEIREQMRYVSRGGLKLEKAIETHGLRLENKICADIGSSTGGFTDCMLQHGAQFVYAVDVGYGQLAWKLRNDPRVCCLERTNARYLTQQEIPQKLDFFSMDVSFISIRLIIPALQPLLNDNAECVLLIKPQFEVGRNRVGKNGVVRNPDDHIQVLEEITSFLTQQEWGILSLDYSPIKGPKGNIEYLAYCRYHELSEAFDIRTLVAEAHEALNKGEQIEE